VAAPGVACAGRETQTLNEMKICEINHNISIRKQAKCQRRGKYQILLSEIALAAIVRG
jgi:hypothetical protein